MFCKEKIKNKNFAEVDHITILCFSIFLCTVGFNLAVTLIYGPLLLKTNRVHRIFVSGKKGVQSFKCVSTISQVFLIIGLLLIQVMANMH